MHWAWIVLGSGFATLFVTYSIRIGAYSVLLPEMIRDFQMTKAQAGMIKSAFSITYLLFAPVVGWLTDRIGGRKIISFFCLFLGGGTFLMSQAGGLTSSILFYSLVGIGAAATWVPIVTLIQVWFGEKRRGLALGILSISYGIGLGLMGLILPIVVLKYHWRLGWSLLGITGLLLIFLNALLLRNRPAEVGLAPWGDSRQEEEEDHFPSVPKMSTGEVLASGRFWLIGLSYFAISYGTYAIVDFGVTYGTMELKIPYRVASLFITVIAFSGVFGGFLWMAFSDYVGRRTSLVVIQLLLSLSVLHLIWAGKNVWLLMGGVGFFGFLYGAIWPMYGACARDFFPKEMTGRVFGLMTIFYGLGAMASAPLTGYLSDLTGTFRWSFGLGALASFLAALLIGFLKKPIEFQRHKD